MPTSELEPLCGRADIFFLRTKRLELLVQWNTKTNRRERAPQTSEISKRPLTTHPKEVRMSELSNSQGVRQPTLVRPTPEREWLTYAEAGAMVGLSRVTLWKLVSAGEVEAARVGRAVRINRESLDAYMRRSAEISTTESR
jgi:excisionase family DNA binding protein